MWALSFPGEQGDHRPGAGLLLLRALFLFHLYFRHIYLSPTWLGTGICRGKGLEVPALMEVSEEADGESLVSTRTPSQASVSAVSQGHEVSATASSFHFGAH